MPIYLLWGKIGKNKISLEIQENKRHAAFVLLLSCQQHFSSLFLFVVKFVRCHALKCKVLVKGASATVKFSGSKKIHFFCVVLFSSLAVVNSLSTDDGPLRWVPVIESLIPITIHRKKVQFVIKCLFTLFINFTMITFGGKLLFYFLNLILFIYLFFIYCCCLHFYSVSYNI